MLPPPLDSWVANPRPPSVIPSGVDPHVIPRLAVARDSVAVLLWGRWRPEALLASPEERGDLRHDALMQSIAREHRMIRVPDLRGSRSLAGGRGSSAARAVRREALSAGVALGGPEYFAAWSVWAQQQATRRKPDGGLGKE